jgi:hypothetical protein
MKNALITKIGSTVTGALGKLAAAARDAVGDLQGAVRAGRELLAAATAKDVWLRSAKPPKAEVLAELDKDLARVRRQWLEVYGPRLLDALAPVVDPNDGTTYRPIRYAKLEEVLPAFDLGTMAALFPDALREGIIAAFPPFEEGPPMSERPALLAAVAAQILDLETQDRLLVDEAAEVGITLADHPENVARRHREARDRQRIDDYNRANAALIRAGRVKAATTVEEAR